MSDTPELRDALARVRWRLRLNRALTEGRAALVAALGIGLATALWNSLAPAAWAIPTWLAVAAAVVAVGVRLVRLWPRESLEEVAARVDHLAGLDDELVSAWWFSRQPRSGAWVEHHLRRAVVAVRGLDPVRLVPIRRPEGLHVPALLAAALTLVLLVPVPRAGDLLADRLAELQLPAPPEREPVAELEESAPEPEPAEAEATAEAAEIELPLVEDEAEAQAEDALPEEGSSQPGDEPPQGEPGDEARDAQEGGEEQPSQPGEESRGEQVPAENAEEMPDSEGSRPAPEPAASQQQGAGEPAEEQGAMLPGGDEVFLQEGGEDMERSGEAEEEMGHATRTGGGEEELEGGEAMAPLEVQLQREILALPEDPSSREQEQEDPEEKLTRAEESLLELQAIDPADEFGRQELLSGEPIPWRYRALVLDYFRALRQRDNQEREEPS